MNTSAPAHTQIINLPFFKAKQFNWKVLLSIFVSLFFHQTAYSQNTAERVQMSEDEFALIQEDSNIMVNAMFEGNADIFIQKTHPALFPYLGGKENFTIFLDAALTEIRQMDLKLIKSELLSPKPYYIVGKDFLAIIPRIQIMQIQEQKIKSVGFLIAVKDQHNQFTYLDGSGLKNDPKVLWEMFPDLPKNITLPANTTEMITE
jgi:hypothetical protein